MSEQKPKFHRWFHNFLIYFALWAYAAIAAIQGVLEIHFAIENVVDWQVVVILLGAMLILLGLFLVKVRFDLAAFRPGVAKELLIACVSATVIVLAIHLILYETGASENMKRLYAAPIFTLWGIALYRYYNDRPYLFES